MDNPIFSKPSDQENSFLTPEIGLVDSIPLSIALAPSGYPYLYTDFTNQEFVSPSLAKKIHQLFSKEPQHLNVERGLLGLGMMNSSAPLPQSIAFWKSFGQLFIQEVCKISGSSDYLIDKNFQINPPLKDLELLVQEAPFMRGCEYLTVEIMQTLWHGLLDALKAELVPFHGKLQDYLEAHNPAWNKVGRVCFHLAENKADLQRPFAFLATYTTHLSTTSSLCYLPLGQALKEYSGQNKRDQLLALLIPVQKAAEQNEFIKGLVDSKAIFHSLAWKAEEAHAFLKSIPQIEAAGVMVRVPDWWTPKYPPKPQITIAIGNAATSTVGLGALLDFHMSFSLPDGERLTLKEMQDLINSKDQFVQIKGKWIEVDQDKLSQVLSHWRKVENQVRHNGLSFSEGLRLLAAMPGQGDAHISLENITKWSKVIEGPWLQDVLNKLRHPNQRGDDIIQTTLHDLLNATLRPYQLLGVQWLWWLYNLRLGGCLADDMGLGKTIQVLSLFLLTKHYPYVHKKGDAKCLHLLIVPASLLGNWQSELKRFAPSLKVWIAHASATGQDKIKKESAPNLSNVDLVITTYGNVYRLPWINQTSWDIIVLDEAQGIKNPTTKQTLTVKSIPSRARFILTGTPIENKLLDLWSLFDFAMPGLLGSHKEFSSYGKKALQDEQRRDSEKHFYASIRQLISPYILRRLKSDKNIISDLPDKTELNAYCFLTKQQAALYQKSVEELKRSLDEEQDDMKRRGLVLSYLMRFKQICNHPDQWLGHGEYNIQSSGKFLRLQELGEIIAAKQERVLIFTQFREIIPALHAVLENTFGRPGLILHGQTAIKDRAKLVEAFQQEQGPPFFILSIKSGGTGLNLTNASHVIHFDRWWNPAVENQATDRAYRIGQKKNVLVHKFICQGTIEEKIDFLISSKKILAEDILAKKEEIAFTEMSNEELMKIVSLDIHRALGDSDQENA